MAPISEESRTFFAVMEIQKILKGPRIDLLKNLIFLLFITKGLILGYRILIGIFTQLRIFGFNGSIQRAIKVVVQKAIILSRRTIPSARKLVQKEIDSSVASIHKGLCPDIPGEHKYLQLPPTGLSENEVIDELDRYKKMEHVEWELGKVSGTIYHGGKSISSLIVEAFRRFALSNPLHPEIFPGVRKMEAEIVAMVINMYNGNSDCCGSVTSGGSESIIMSIKAHRDWAMDAKGITSPEIIVPVSAHAAFDKGCNYFGIKLIHIPVLENGCADVKKMHAAINRNTIMLVGSTPSFPHGSLDDIPALAKLALKYKIGLHVDSCLGGFIVPFMEDAGFKLPFYTDFRVKGVTAISCDTHKYGFAPKGSSVVLYHSPKLRKFQYFQQMDWPGGVYGSPTVAGSRPGALSAGCWASLLYFGRSGYVDSTREIVQCARLIKIGISKIKDLTVIGDPILSVVAFKSASKEINIYSIGDHLSKKGYHLNVLQFPAAIHIACTMLTTLHADAFMKDLVEIVDILKKNPVSGGDTAKIYGTAAEVPDRTIIKEVVNGFLDGLTKI